MENNNNNIDLIKYIKNIENKNISNILWKLNNNDLYNKFTQYNYNIILEQNDNLKNKDNISFVKTNEEKLQNKIIKEKLVFQYDNIENKLNNDKNICQNKDADNNICQDKDTDKNICQDKDTDKNMIEKKKPGRKKNIIEYKFLPFELICLYTDIVYSDISKKYIKNKLIEKISDKNYIKVFGIKKSSEIMSGIVNNNWNKSLVIFISFLLDKKIIYEKKEELFNKELKNIETITL